MFIWWSRVKAAAATAAAASQMIEWAGGEQAIQGKGMERLASPEIIARANPDIILMTEFGYDRLGSLDQAKTLPGVAQTNAATQRPYLPRRASTS